MSAVNQFTRGPTQTFQTSARVHHFEKPVFPDGLWHIIQSENPELLPICSIDRADDHCPETRARAKHDARLIAAAFNAATQLADAGYDAVEVIQRLPKFLAIFDEIVHADTGLAVAMAMQGPEKAASFLRRLRDAISRADDVLPDRATEAQGDG